MLLLIIAIIIIIHGIMMMIKGTEIMLNLIIRKIITVTFVFFYAEDIN